MQRGHAKHQNRRNEAGNRTQRIKVTKHTHLATKFGRYLLKFKVTYLEKKIGPADIKTAALVFSQ